MNDDYLTHENIMKIRKAVGKPAKVPPENIFTEIILNGEPTMVSMQWLIDNAEHFDNVEIREGEE